MKKEAKTRVFERFLRQKTAILDVFGEF